MSSNALYLDRPPVATSGYVQMASPFEQQNIELSSGGIGAGTNGIMVPTATPEEVDAFIKLMQDAAGEPITNADPFITTGDQFHVQLGDPNPWNGQGDYGGIGWSDGACNWFNISYGNCIYCGNSLLSNGLCLCGGAMGQEFRVRVVDATRPLNAPYQHDPAEIDRLREALGFARPPPPAPPSDTSWKKLTALELLANARALEILDALDNGSLRTLPPMEGEVGDLTRAIVRKALLARKELAAQAKAEAEAKAASLKALESELGIEPEAEAPKVKGRLVVFD